MQFVADQPSTDALLVVSDGSCNEGNRMSYGVVIGTSTGVRLLEAQGPAAGSISSHRAECYGCLAGAVILLHISVYTGQRFPVSLSVRTISDNQGMIRRLTERQKYSVAYANTTLAPDWDLIEEIHQVYSTLLHPPNHVYEWVLGHQDKCRSSNITIEARYNIEADVLAGEYYPLGGKPLPAPTLLLPHSRCALHLRGRVLQGHYRTQIRRAAAQSSFTKYMTKRHGWSQDTYDDIDWKAFQTAARNFDGDRIHLMKLVHDKLPTNMTKSRYHPFTAAHCHFCPAPETFNHLCTSTCNIRSLEFRNQILQELNDILSDKTPRQFAKTFLSALHNWLDGSTHQGTTSWDGPDQLRLQQERIGWQQMFKGYFTKSWSAYLRRTIKAHQVQKWLHHNEITKFTRGTDSTNVVFNPYHPDKFLYRPIAAHRILSSIIRKIWSLMGKLWRDHTTHIHASITRSSPGHRQELQAQIRALHSLKDQTLAVHRDQYFYPSVEQFLDQATNIQMRRYLSRYRPVILHSVGQADKIATNATPITQFFARRHTPPIRPPLLHPAQEEPIHRKHARRRIPLIRTITEFFTRLIPPDTAPIDKPPVRPDQHSNDVT